MRDTIANRKTLQIATQKNGAPWICTVYFVLLHGKFYWLSLPERRHSQEIKNNDNVAIAVVIEPDKPVVGLQAAGRARIVTDSREVKGALDAYVQKYGQGSQFVELFLAGKNRHKLYCFTPERCVLFDERTEAAPPVREINLM